MSSNKDSISRVFLVAFVVCLVCAIVVASAVVALRPVQLENKTLDTNRNILVAAGLYADGIDINATFADKVEPRLVDLRTGVFVNDVPEGIKSLKEYDQRVATRQPALSDVIPADEDIASLKRKAHFAKVYLVSGGGGEVEKIVLPISGYGLWSTLYGYLVLGNDYNTVVGITFTDHAETPGLGGEVDNPSWKAQWPGKKVYDDQGEVLVGLKKGGVDPANTMDATHKVDALAGATLTSNGVNRLVQYWMGPEGFGPFLAQLREKGV